MVKRREREKEREGESVRERERERENEDASHERLTKPEVVFYWWFSLNPVTTPLLRLILKSFNFG